MADSDKDDACHHNSATNLIVNNNRLRQPLPPPPPFSLLTQLDLARDNCLVAGKELTSDDNMSPLYKSPTYLHQLSARQKAFKDDKQFCDFVIVVADQTFHVHRSVIAACSDYFRVMLTGDYRESRELRTTLEGVKPEAIGAIINFAYTGEILINSDNVLDLIVAASIIQAEEIQEQCTERILSQLTHSNCIDILDFADKYSLNTLYDSSFLYCLRRFKYIALSPEFLETEARLLIRIISDDNLKCREEEIFEFILKWVAHDPEIRIHDLPDLMEHVRFSLMSQKYLCETVSLNGIVANCHKSHHLVERAKDFLLHWKVVPLSNPTHPFHNQENKLRHRNPATHKIYAIGGWNQRAPIATFEEYDPFNDKWKKLDSMKDARCGIGAAIMEGIIYFFGGHDGKHYLDSISRFNLETREWMDEDGLRMENARTSIAVGKVDDCFYIIGGQDGKKTLDQVHRFNPFSRKWSQCSRMISPRLGAGIAVIRNKIYVVGGGTPPVHEEEALGGASFSSVEYYNTELDVWFEVSPMRTARKHAGCVVHDDIIYVVGGRDMNGHLNTAEKYDPSTDSWVEFPAMQYKRSGLGLVCLDNVLYAIGGFDGTTHHRSVEAYDLSAGSSGKWEAKTNMSDGRLGGGFVAYTGFE